MALHLDRPIKLMPEFVEKVWGGDLFPRVGSDAGPTGEMWLASGLAETSTVLADQPDTTLRSAFFEHREVLLPPEDQDRFKEFPLLVKAIDTADRLSVQVHPGQEGHSKAECWLILRAREDAKIYVGLNSGVTQEEFRTALEAGEAEDLLAVIHPKPGDFITVPPGTVHALGAGVTLLEIQEPLNVTFRLSDWNRVGLDGRPRELHVEQGLAALDLEAPHAGLRPALPLEEKVLHREELLLFPQRFFVHRLRIERDWRLRGRGALEVLVGLSGHGELLFNGTSIGPLDMLDTYIVPPACADTVVVPAVEGCEFLLARVFPLPPENPS